MTQLEKGIKDQMAWTRDQVHLLRRLLKELTARVRSLRFFENVRLLQRDGEAARGAASHSAVRMQLGGRPDALAQVPAVRVRVGLRHLRVRVTSPLTLR